MALHDVGTSASLRLLGALAGASGARVQRLSIRRQGQGVALAVIQFVEVPLSDGSEVRIYSTDVNADTQTRHSLALLLLARSRLSVLMLGELPVHALTTTLKPLSEAVTNGPWPNRDMLLLPLGSATTLASQAVKLVGGSGVAVRITPQASRPNDAWSFISGAWNRLQGQSAPNASLNTELARAVPKPTVPDPEAPTQRMELGHSPAYHRARQPATPSPATVRWTDYAQRCAAIKGVMRCCVFDISSPVPLAEAGQLPAADRLAIQGALLMGAMDNAARHLSLNNTMPEATISFGQEHLLLRPVPGHPGVVLHMVLQTSPTNLTLARMQLERVLVPH
jgi:hypothetical protein